MSTSLRINPINNSSTTSSDRQPYLQQFHVAGYCIIDDIYDPAELDAIEGFFEEFKRSGPSIFQGGVRYEEVDKTQRQVRAMHPHRHSEQALQWALNERVLEVLEALFGNAPLLAQTMYYYKPPGSKGQAMHQDNFFLLAKPTTCIAAWTPLDDAEVENGCLYVAPGSQHCEIFCPEGDAPAWMDYGESHIRPFPRDFKPVPVPVKRGQTMFFGGQLIHGSGPNRHPSRSRRTFIGHYVNEASEQISNFYHPVLDRHGKIVSSVAEATGGGACGDDIGGGYH
jgi:phytanoyl-CoA hydroxylase